MSNFSTLSNPSIVWNGRNISEFIKPNTVVTNLGLGERTVRGTIAGTVTSENAETKFGKLNFEFESSTEAIKIIREMTNNLSLNVFTITAKGFNLTAQKMALTNNPDLTLQHEGSIPIELMGEPLV